MTPAISWIFGSDFSSAVFSARRYKKLFSVNSAISLIVGSGLNSIVLPHIDTGTLFVNYAISLVVGSDLNSIVLPHIDTGNSFATCLRLNESHGRL